MISIRSRHPVSAKKDQRTFTNTAAKSKVVNLTQKVYRGGIRF